ncbi:uncharacterized protein DUF397 [Nocardiopsis sp. Huas11]|uniref:DUF397 domain-containing protein n=1 Tax=Nocardiopsis sp. Huas11 TaxID=2183912 RepID=UPI000EAC7E63|nr:DUF397 domain-containing protein [Nocardiopsis sp. Huas11]RKS09815.1 uncharacterized protein DUF397 [Nocardiopsis sp. Huas11]
MTNERELPGLRWWKSSYSGSKGGDCVEVAEGTCHMYLRDSKYPELGHFTFGTGEWCAFLVASEHG